MTDTKDTSLTPVQQKFIVHWGEMGTRWGINRTVAQVHALLYLSARPLHAEAIAATLGVARSNVSTSLKELQGWGIIRIVHAMGDRRDHFESIKDVWELYRQVMDERKRREIDPTIALLGELAQRLANDTSAPKALRDRVMRMHEFIGTLSGWYEQVRVLPKSTLVTLMKLGSKVARLIPGSSRKD